MVAELEDKTETYEQLLTEALSVSEPVAPTDTPLGTAATEFQRMAESYLEDGRHFKAQNDPVNALAAYAYGHAWLDAGARIGLFSVPEEAGFTV